MGLTNMVSDAEIANTILFAENLEEALQSLVQKANDARWFRQILQP